MTKDVATQRVIIWAQSAITQFCLGHCFPTRYVPLPNNVMTKINFQLTRNQVTDKYKSK